MGTPFKSSEGHIHEQKILDSVVFQVDFELLWDWKDTFGTPATGEFTDGRSLGKPILTLLIAFY